MRQWFDDDFIAERRELRFAREPVLSVDVHPATAAHRASARRAKRDALVYVFENVIQRHQHGLSRFGLQLVRLISRRGVQVWVAAVDGEFDRVGHCCLRLLVNGNW